MSSATPRDISRRSGPRDLVRGLGNYLDDLGLPDLLSCHFARSVLAHARLSGVDVEEARSVQGVRAVMTAEDLRLSEIPGNLRHGPPAPHMGRPPLARNRVRYVGEPIALVVADDPYIAADAAQLVIPDLDPLPSIVDPVHAAEDEVLLFEEAGSNVVAHTSTGSSSNRDYDVSISLEVINQRLAPLHLEPLGIIAQREGRGLHVWCGHQAPHRLRDQLALFLDLDPSLVRVTVPDVGGGFGARGMLHPEYLVVAAAALELGRPLKWLATRRQDLVSNTHGRGHAHNVELSGDRDGTIRRARIEILADMGAYPHNASMIPGFTAFMAGGPYRIDELTVETTLVVTNTAPVGTYRGAGRPEATYAIERALEAFALEVGRDPVEVRKTNLITADELPLRTSTGAIYDSGDYTRALDLALELADIEGVRDQQSLGADSSRSRLGIGVACYIERAGGPLTEGEHASVEIDGTGEITVRVGAVDTGQGHDSLWRALAGDPFDVNPESIRVISGDTAEVPEGVGTFASRSTQVCGSVVTRCSSALHSRARDIAADMLEVSPADLVTRDGRFQVVDSRASSIGLADVAEQATDRGIELRIDETWVPGAHTFPYGTHVAIVEVDTETGDVRLLRAIAVDDCGNVIDAAGALGQVHGSLAQGIGQARYEGFRYDDTGQPLTSTLVDYLAPRASDLPFPEVAHLVSPAPSNPLGAKGIGESGCIGFPPAMVNAVLDALRPIGVTHIDMPLSAQNVWSKIRRTTDHSPSERTST